MRKLLLGLLLTLPTLVHAQTFDVSGAWEIRAASNVVLVETNMSQAYRHVLGIRNVSLIDGSWLGVWLPSGEIRLEGDISDTNVLTLNYIYSGPDVRDYGTFTSELHLDVDDNRWEGTFSGAIAGQYLDGVPFVARRHVPFSPRTYRGQMGATPLPMHLTDLRFEQTDGYGLHVTNGTTVDISGPMAGATFILRGTCAGQACEAYGYHDGLDFRTDVVYLWFFGAAGGVAAYTVPR